MTHRYKITVSYDGTHYAGWQIQPDERTIQGALEHVIAELTHEKPRVHSSGRTDSGVHAREQVAHFDLSEPVQPSRFSLGMNALLEADIRVLRMTRIRRDFHARRSAVGKEYRYHLWTGNVVPPYVRLYRTHAPGLADINAMRAAAASLTGGHDFAAFSANPSREIGGTVRQLDMLEVRRRGHEVTIVARADGFLYKMVRSLAGFLVRVGNGELSPEQAKEILRSITRTARVPTAPPQGLFLWRVFY